MSEAAIRLARSGRAQAEKDLAEELGIPSVGTLSQHGPDCRRNADWLAARFTAMGMDVRFHEADGGQPTVWAEWNGAPGKPMLTIYGHYDVQPADPLDEWVSPPFDAQVRDGCMYGRGACDNKGQHLASLKAAEYAFACGGPPINLRFLIEGEEEDGGNVLPDLLAKHASELASDYVFIHDTQLLQLLTGLRGHVYAEIEARGAASDLHSGAFGGVAPNPLNTLVHILAGLKDRDGRILIPGFYDHVRRPDPTEFASWERLPTTAESLLELFGAPALEGEDGFTVHERMFARPTMDIHGIVGGFVGEGAKTVIPAKATAKLSMRLVPDQDLDAAFEQLAEYVPTLATPGIEIEVRRVGSGSQPAQFSVDHPGIAAASAAFAAAFGERPALVRAGYSIPVLSHFAAALPHAHIFATGFVRESDAAHAPNERILLENFHRGTEMVIHLMDELART